MGSKMVRRAAAIISVLAFLFLAIPWPVSAGESLTETSEHFTIFYHREDARIALDLLAIADREHRRVSGIIGYQLTRTIRIYLAEDAEEFRILTQGRLPEWGIGAALPRRAKIVLISPRNSPGRSDIHQVFAHELCHVILGQALGEATAPRWLDEGLAMFVSHEWKLGRSILVTRALLFGSLIPLDEIVRLNSFGRSKANLAYAESFLAVAFIVDNYGEASLHMLIRQLAGLGDIDLAMRASLGITYREFQLVWRGYVTRRFNWASTLSNPLVLWLFIFSLFVLAFILQRRHTGKIMKRWELAEDGLEEPYEPPESEERWSGP